MSSHLLSIAYLPPISYLATLEGGSSALLLEAHEHYQKQSYRNRAEIATAQGVQSLVVPVRRPHGHHTLIKDVEVDYATDWVRVHLGAIRAAYAKTAYFIHYYPALETILSSGERSLWHLDLLLLSWLLEVFQMDCIIQETDRYRLSNNSSDPFSAHQCGESLDFRSYIHPKRNRPSYPTYYQVFSDRQPFISNLSLIDLLFNMGGPEGRRYLSNCRPSNSGWRVSVEGLQKR